MTLFYDSIDWKTFLAMQRFKWYYPGTYLVELDHYIVQVSDSILFKSLDFFHTCFSS